MERKAQQLAQVRLRDEETLARPSTQQRVEAEARAAEECEARIRAKQAALGAAEARREHWKPACTSLEAKTRAEQELKETDRAKNDVPKAALAAGTDRAAARRPARAWRTSRCASTAEEARPRHAADMAVAAARERTALSTEREATAQRAADEAAAGALANGSARRRARPRAGRG